MKDKKSYEVIQHDGIVKKVDTNTITVTLPTSCACSGCHAEALCNLSRKQDKSIEINGNYNVSPGDQVTVLMKQSMGYRAVVLGYLIPLFLVVSGLSVMISLGIQELIAGLGSLAILVLYFMVLHIFREQISRSFTFSIREE
jgi:positive regulator of sigma E activity